MRSRISLALMVGSIVLGTSCRSAKSDDTSSGGPNAGTFDKAGLLKAFGECAFANYKEFATAAKELADATAKAEADGTPASRDAALLAWRKAMDIWERAELYQFGPAAMTGSPGGADLRDPIYAWPLVGRCLIDQTIVSKAYEGPGFGTSSLVSLRTLAAAEYLLFYAGADNGCTPDSAINTQGQWSALGAPEIAKRKLTYAKIVTADVADRAQKLLDAWDPAKGNFLAEMQNAGKAKAFPSQQGAFNAVSDAMFYIGDQARNMKLGKPAGLTSDCAASPCPDAVESPFAKRSKDHIRANLAGYDQLLLGCGTGNTGLGFDDYLVAVGAQAVVDKLTATSRDSRAALDELKEATLEEDIAKNPAGVKKLFEALRANEVAMKTDFVTVLDLEIPKGVIGDND
jgi:uncharacterized protein